MIGQIVNRGKRKTALRGASLALLLSTTALVGVSTPALAADTTWDGSTNSNWFDGSNWDTNAVPTAGDLAIITNAGSTPIVGGPGAVANGVTVGDGVTAGLFIQGNTAVLTSSGAFFIGANAGGVGAVTVQNGGHLVMTAGNTTALGIVGGSTGNLIVTGAGSLFQAAGVVLVGHDGTGNFTLSAGATASTGVFGLGTNPNGTGTALVTGAGTQLTAGGITVGNLGSGTFTLADGASATVTTILTVGQDAGSSGTLTLTGGSSMCVGGGCGGNVFIATQAGSTGAINIGNGGAADQLNAGTYQFGAGTGTLNFNHTSTNYFVYATFSGAGAVNQIAGVTRLTADSSAFAGTTNITGGTLHVNGALGGTVNVNGGTLSGVGTLSGALTINNGGNITPGNSIGTLNVANVTINSGSTYTVELNDGGFAAGANNDLINATGTATINGGAVHVTPVNGTDDGTTYTPGTYTILTAAGGVTGTFDTLTDDYAFLNFALGYGANNVLLTSSFAATSFCVPGMSANQCAAGEGAFSLGSGSLFNAVLNLSTAEAPGALDQLSGEIHASARTALIEDSRFVRDAATDRVRAAFEGVAAGAVPVLAYGEGGRELVSADTRRFAVWGQGFGSWGRWQGDGNAAALDRSTGGLLVGGDAAVSEKWRLGLTAGYSHSGFNAPDRASSGASDNFHIGLYGGGRLGRVGLRFGGAYSWHDVTTSRMVVFPGFSDTLSARYGAGTTQIFAETGYEVETGNARFEPFANLAYVRRRTDGFTETGGAAALTAAASTVETIFTTVGLRAETEFLLGGRTARARGGLGWRHAFGASTPATTLNFAGGATFAIAGVPVARDALVLDAVIDFSIAPTALLGVAYSGHIGSGVSDHAFKVNLGVRF